MSNANSDLLIKPRQSLLEMQQPVPSQQKERWRSTAVGKQNTQLIEVLNAVLPPREFRDAGTGESMVQHVSWEPNSRDDVIALQMKLDERLQERQARENGICPVREELYAQCFDELIREITIECPERGLLLLRARDEARMTIAAYQTLYASSITFGMRKTLQAEQGNTELQKMIDRLEAEKRSLQAHVQDLRGLHESIEKRNAELRQQEEKRMQEEKEFLSYQGQYLEQFLKNSPSM